MKKILFSLILLYVNLYSKEIIVCKECKINEIKIAVELAKDYDTIIIKKNIYKEYNILITKKIIIKGDNYPIIDGEQKGEIIKIMSDSVFISGLEIKNVGVSYTTDYSAIRVKNSNHFSIMNMKLEKLFFGIYLEKSNYGKIINNEIKGDAKDEYNSGNGIHLWYCKNIDIKLNIINNVRDGIYLEFADECLVEKNISFNNIRYGLHYMFSNNDKYIGNDFYGNGAGVAVMFSKNIQMYENTFRKNWGASSYGLLLKEINDAEIKGNIFEENTVGINLEGANRILYENNSFINNGWALKMRGGCYHNIFSKNNFLYNSFDVSYSGKINDNEFNNNYWSSYTGYDLNKDGIGDISYRPVKLFSYIANRTPESIILLRSLFIDIIDFSEKVSPVFTPIELVDKNPSIKKIK